MAQATTLLDAHDQRAFTIYREQRIEVPLARVSPHLVRAIVAVEDQRFYDHKGIDLVRVAGAAISNLRQGTRAQGGSTLTQQLARNSFLTPEKTYTRKLKELVLARRIEAEFSKDEILELYLNKVYFGAGLYGAEAAALGYFGKPAADLDLAQAAMLAGLVKSPSTYAPTVDLARATARRNVVLTVMRDSGVITADEHKKAVREPSCWRTRSGAPRPTVSTSRRPSAASWSSGSATRVSTKAASWSTRPSIWRCRRPPRPRSQRSLKEIEARQAARRRKGAPRPPLPRCRRRWSPWIRGPAKCGRWWADATSAPAPSTGPGRRSARRAPRSSRSSTRPRSKPATRRRPLITNLDAPINTPQGAWTPEDEHLESPLMTMRTALRTSSNRAAVHMLDDVGIASAVSLAERMGVGGLPSVPSLALGAGDVTLMSMTAAYGAFANQGLLPVPTLIRRVETASGEVLYERKAEPQRVVSESTAFLMTTHAGRRRQQRHRVAGTAGRLHPAGGGQDRDDQRLSRRVVHRLHPAPGLRRVGRLRPAADDHGGRLRRRARRAAVGALHDAGDEGERARLVSGACRGHHRDDLSAERQAGDPGVCRRGRRARLHRVLRQRPRSDRVPAICTCSAPGAACSAGLWRPLAAGPAMHHSRRPREVRAVAEGPAPPPSPAAAKTAEPEPPKKRGFWSRVFGGRRDDRR